MWRQQNVSSCYVNSNTFFQHAALQSQVHFGLRRTFSHLSETAVQLLLLNLAFTLFLFFTLPPPSHPSSSRRTPESCWRLVDGEIEEPFRHQLERQETKLILSRASGISSIHSNGCAELRKLLVSLSLFKIDRLWWKSFLFSFFSSCIKYFLPFSLTHWCQ